MQLLVWNQTSKRCWSFFAVPCEFQKMVRTTNPIERFAVESGQSRASPTVEV